MRGEREGRGTRGGRFRESAPHTPRKALKLRVFLGQNSGAIAE